MYIEKIYTIFPKLYTRLYSTIYLLKIKNAYNPGNITLFSNFLLDILLNLFDISWGGASGEVLRELWEFVCTGKLSSNINSLSPEPTAAYSNIEKTFRDR